MRGARNAAPKMSAVSTAANTTSFDRRELCTRSLSRKAAKRPRRAPWIETGAASCGPCGTGAGGMRSATCAWSFMRSPGPAEDADARIDPHVHEIDDEVDEDEEERNKHEI